MRVRVWLSLWLILTLSIAATLALILHFGSKLDYPIADTEAYSALVDAGFLVIALLHCGAHSPTCMRIPFEAFTFLASGFVWSTLLFVVFSTGVRVRAVFRARPSAA